MAVKHQTVSLTDAPADLTAEADTGHYSNNTRGIRIYNSGTTEVFLGASNVSSTNYGARLAAGEAIFLTLVSDEKIYGVCAALGTGTVRLLHTGL